MPSFSFPVYELGKTETHVPLIVSMSKILEFQKSWTSYNIWVPFLSMILIIEIQ